MIIVQDLFLFKFKVDKRKRTVTNARVDHPFLSAFKFDSKIDNDGFFTKLDIIMNISVLNEVHCQRNVSDGPT